MAAVDQLCKSSSLSSAGMATAAPAGVKPVPMKLFSTWEVDKSTPSCIPRMCSLNMTHLVLLKPLESDLQSLIIAIKMQSSSRRILRSNEILLPPNGLLDTELDLTFTLQYPHFLKGDGNRLQIMLQRRKKYKNRTILGYKTLAAGHINMSQVLQQTADHELCLYSDIKEQSHPVAQVMILSLSSQPADQDDRRGAAPAGDTDRSPGEMSDDDEVRDYQDFSDDDVSDVEALPGDDDRPTGRSRKLHATRPTFVTRQRNLKQKFAALLRRFKVTDEVLESVQELGDREAGSCYVEELLDDIETLSESDVDMDTISVRSTPKPKLRPFFSGRAAGSNSPMAVSKATAQVMASDKVIDDNNSYKTDSDSNYELDDKPVKSAAQRTLSLTPGILHYTNGRTERDPRSTNGNRKFSLDQHLTFDQKLPPNVGSIEKPGLDIAPPSAAEVSPQRALTEQMAAILSTNNSLPDCIVMVDAHEWHSQMVAHALQNANYRTICTCSAADVRAIITAIVNKIQKYCSKNTSVLSPMKVAIVGGDSYVGAVLRPYVELFSAKSPDWQTNIRFLIVPYGGGSTVGKHLARLDAKYASLFNDSFWKELFAEKLDSSARFDIAEITSRIMHYLTGATHAVQLPLGEAILTNRDKGHEMMLQGWSTADLFTAHQYCFSDTEMEVRLGMMDIGNSSILPSLSDPEDASAAMLSSSPPTSSHIISSTDNKGKDSTIVNSIVGLVSPQNTISASNSTCNTSSTDSTVSSDTVDLQLDYWMMTPRSDPPEKSDKTARSKEVKYSLKTMFRSMRVFRMQSSAGGTSAGGLADQPSSTPNALSMIVVTREKKQKIMRLKKSKEPDAKKSQQIDGISRLICTSKSQHHPLSVSIDGVEWTGVKFFQVSAQWQTHIKNLPVLVFGSSFPSVMSSSDVCMAGLQSLATCS